MREPVISADVVLMYHSVSAAPATPSFRRYVLDPSLFEEHLAFLKSDHWATTTISGGLLRASDADPHKRVALTFDDGFADFAANVLPLLEKYEMSATLYVITAYVDGTAVWLSPEGEEQRPMLSWGALKEIGDSPWVEIGAHSHTHAELDRLPRTGLEGEVRLPKTLLEEHLHRPVQSFSFPFGYHAPRVREAVKDAGYTTACVVDELPVAAARSALAIPRFSVPNTASAESVARLLATPFTQRHRARSTASRLLWRAYRRSPLWARPACNC